MLLRARVVFPVSAPPIDDGAVTIKNGQILEVGRFRDLSCTTREIQDLGEVCLLPGLINAHCHLDYTDMAGTIAPPATFPEWINAIIAMKAGWDYSDYARSWVHGAHQLLDSGTTTVGDIESVPEMLAEVWNATPLRVHSFIELISVRRRRSASEMVADAEAGIAQANPLPGRTSGSLSPHALYSTSEDLLRAAAGSAGPLAIHVAESAAEDEMYRYRSGPMFEWLLRNERDMSDCTGISSVNRLFTLGLLSDRLLAIHCNYVDDDDVRLLAGGRVNVVHCPRSHDYFGHAPFRLGALQSAGLNICLATDSLASVRGGGFPRPTLSLFRELQLALDLHPGLSPTTALEMVTVNPARALGRRGELGCIAPGARADLITVAANGIEDLVHAGQPTAVMIDGHWQRITTV